jgi:hypothetical protein
MNFLRRAQLQGSQSSLLTTQGVCSTSKYVCVSELVLDMTNVNILTALILSNSIRIKTKCFCCVNVNLNYESVSSTDTQR